MRVTPPFVAIETWIWNDPRVRGLDRDARSLFGLLLTCPLMSKVPGLILAGVGALADEWKSTPEEFRDAFAKVQKAGLCDADWEARVVYVVPILTEMVCNRPKGPSQAAAFGTIVLRMAPDCPLTRRVEHDLLQLMVHSPALMESFRRCQMLSNEDARSALARPIPTQPRQMSLQLPDAPVHTPAEPSSAPDAGGESAELLPMVGSGQDATDSPPTPRAVSADPEAELAEGLRELVDQAGAALQLPPSGFTVNQQVNLRTQWRQAHAAGWRRQDLADLGRFIRDGGLGWLNKKTPAEYLGSMYLGDALARMDKARGKAAPPAPRRPAVGPRLRWHVDTLGRADEVDDGAGDRFVALRGDAWELEQLATLYRRYRAGECLTMADVRQAMAARPKPPVPEFTPLTRDEVDRARELVRQAG